MKKIKLILVVILMISGQFGFAQKQVVDTKKSEIKWIGKKIGGQHTGFIQLKSGEFELKNDVIISGNFVVDMTSITNTDLKDAAYNEKLVGHLKSDDFFGVEKYPKASIKITKKSKFVDGKATINADLTIKAITQAISFDIVKGNKEYTASIEIDRSIFDVRYGSNSFFDNLGDKVIDNIFILNIKLAI